MIQYPLATELRSVKERIQSSVSASAVEVELARVVNYDPVLRAELDKIATNKMNFLGRSILTRAMVVGLHFGLRLAELRREHDRRAAA